MCIFPLCLTDSECYDPFQYLPSNPDSASSQESFVSVSPEWSPRSICSGLQHRQLVSSVRSARKPDFSGDVLCPLGGPRLPAGDCALGTVLPGEKHHAPPSSSVKGSLILTGNKVIETKAVGLKGQSRAPILSIKPYKFVIPSLLQVLRRRGPYKKQAESALVRLGLNVYSAPDQ